MDLSWMAWTSGTAILFACILLGLVIMTVWAIKWPPAPRRGILRIHTTPGDRFFLSLLGSAFICLGWLAFFGTPLNIGLGICFFYSVAVFRWV